MQLYRCAWVVMRACICIDTPQDEHEHAHGRRKGVPTSILGETQRLYQRCGRGCKVQGRAHALSSASSMSTSVTSSCLKRRLYLESLSSSSSAPTLAGSPPRLSALSAGAALGSFAAALGSLAAACASVGATATSCAAAVALCAREPMAARTSSRSSRWIATGDGGSGGGGGGGGGAGSAVDTAT
eukprot:5486717-Pleurochrysis_carterae.AAC.2